MVAKLLSIFSLLNRNMADPKAERTLLAVKPYGKPGYKLVAGKFVWPSKHLLHNHYAELSSKPFFPGLIEYMSSGPVFAMVWEGTDVASMGRKMLGATNLQESSIRTIRGEFIALWFTPDEVVSYGLAQKNWICE
ncbi:unnamed protein product [Candidula unifasciata]|uniref:nucleoside-diphosphate kinase n=1 Tax=Candidula unifasciata TaxID=100452 RepID=A0A8S3ZX45_9EUPU|nr:unnamed protein product [Candidula unifasciata]